MMNLKITVLFILLSGLHCALSQVVILPDTISRNTASIGTSFFYQDFEKMSPDFRFKVDTSFRSIQRYEPTFRKNNYFAHLGNLGLAHNNIVYEPDYITGFSTGITAFNQNLFVSDSIRYYLINKPYTAIDYVMGPKREQNLGIKHAQNVSSWFTVGLNFNYVSSPGLYRNQKGDDKNFVATTRFQTKNYRYVVLANYIHNKLKMRENGGIQNDSVFEQNVITSRDGIPVNLNTANNYLKENSVFIKQLFNLSKQTKLLSLDTVGLNPPQNRKVPGIVAYSIQYSKTTLLYEHSIQDNNGFYQFTFDSTNQTYDSTHIFKFENELSWTNADPLKQHWLTASIKVKHQYTEYSVDSTRFIYNLIIPTGEVSMKFSEIARIGFLGDYIIGDEYSGDFSLRGKFMMKTGLGGLYYQLKSSRQEVPRIYQYYKSNHFIWENSLKKQRLLVNELGFKVGSFRAGISVNSVDNFVYFDEQAMPRQINMNMSVIQGQISKIFLFGDFTFDAQLIYQDATQSESIRVPEWIADVSVFYTKPLFSGATTIQTGFDFFYFSSYYAYGYMPATRSFYVQNEKKLGDYIFADVFLNLKIKRAYLFLKYNNLGFLFNDYRYYMVPSYPMKDGAFRFGISWSFYD